MYWGPAIRVIRRVCRIGSPRSLVPDRRLWFSVGPGRVTDVFWALISMSEWFASLSVLEQHCIYRLLDCVGEFCCLKLYNYLWFLSELKDTVILFIYLYHKPHMFYVPGHSVWFYNVLKPSPTCYLIWFSPQLSRPRDCDELQSQRLEAIQVHPYPNTSYKNEFRINL